MKCQCGEEQCETKVLFDSETKTMLVIANEKRDIPVYFNANSCIEMIQEMYRMLDHMCRKAH